MADRDPALMPPSPFEIDQRLRSRLTEAVLAQGGFRHDALNAFLRARLSGQDITRGALFGDPAIEADPIAGPILALTDGKADTREGRLPTLITVRYWDGDTARTVTGLYDIIWSTHGRFLRGRTLRLEGLRLRDRNGTTAKLDAAWAARRG